MDFIQTARGLSRPRRQRPVHAVVVVACCVAAVACPLLAHAGGVGVGKVAGRHAIVVAGHPEAARAGVETLEAGGNAIDAAVTVSLSLGVAEPFGSGLGGKLVMLYHDAGSKRTYVVDAMNVCPSIDVDAYLKRPVADHSHGYGSVCVPGLAAGLWTAHQRWGKRAWAGDVAPAIRLARDGFEILPKTRALFATHEDRLRQGNAEIARLYLPYGTLPAVGARLANPDLARTMELLAENGRDGFYRGPVADAVIADSKANGGILTPEDLARCEATVVEPIGIDFRGYRILCSPPPTNGPPVFLTIMKALEDEDFDGGPLRTAENLDRIGRVWRVVMPLVQDSIADVPGARASFERMVSPDSIAAIRARSLAIDSIAFRRREPIEDEFASVAAASTTHFIVADDQGNIVCATQSLSLHFGAGVVAPGTGVILNDTMSNFSFRDPDGVNYVAPGKKPRSTISPTIVLRDGRPVLAVGLPGGGRIPTAMLQVLLDHLALDVPLDVAIGDTRVHFERSRGRNQPEMFMAESSLSSEAVDGLRDRGWKVELPEPAGTGNVFGGVNAVEVSTSGGYIGYADMRRTNAAEGY